MALDLMAGIKVLNAINTFFLKLSINEHYQSISRGVIDSRDALYFLSFIVIALISTKIALNVKKG